MAGKASTLLKQLEKIKIHYGDDAGSRKLEMLQALNASRLSRAGEVLRLHEVLCFLRAYPDDRPLLDQVESMLGRFADRRDLRAHRRALDDSGIAGTVISYPFFWFTALWLARRLPRHLSINWTAFEKKDRLEGLLHLLMPFTETLALEALSFTPREWIHRLKGPEETDAAFLINRFKTVGKTNFERENLFESLDIPIRLSPGPDTPSRTRARYQGAGPVVFQTRPLVRSRPDLRREIRRCQVAVRPVPVREARKLIDLAREAMVTRSRDFRARR